MAFDVVGTIRDVEVIAVGSRIRDLARLRRKYGDGRWRKLKGKALVRLEDGSLRQAEIHWYEAHGIGRRGPKVKRIID